MIGMSTVRFEMSSTSRFMPQLLSSTPSGLPRTPGTLGGSPARSDAVGAIMAIVSGMKSAGAAKDGAAGQDAASAISAYVEQNTFDVEDARNALSGYLASVVESNPETPSSYVEAVRNGTMTIERLSDAGYEAKSRVLLQVSDGKVVGSGATYDNSGALDMIRDRMGIAEGDSTIWGTDRATGKNASWMAMGAEVFYLTW